jgi:hypothetical protein
MSVSNFLNLEYMIVLGKYSFNQSCVPTPILSSSFDLCLLWKQYGSKLEFLEIQFRKSTFAQYRIALRSNVKNTYPYLLSPFSTHVFRRRWRKIVTKKSFFTFIRRWRNLFSCYSCLKFSTSVWAFVDGAKEEQMNFFGGDIFRQREWKTGLRNAIFWGIIATSSEELLQRRDVVSLSFWKLHNPYPMYRYFFAPLRNAIRCRVNATLDTNWQFSV